MKNSIKITSLIPMIWVMLIVCISCEKDTAEFSAEETQETVDQEKIVQERAFPEEQGVVETIQLYGQTVQVEKINGQYILEGDILVIPDDVAKSTGRTNSFTRWPDNKELS
ncbi:hypothetical protein [uncultured Aquimarina sp.]|uniref:hypothetical protein n=1 Tax=uncultured Aquimarina sp. TaxID=575652 RepID=UPI00260909BC|nr:hypothetical protein [uncultured Aquimarina sp.]